jgi:hypothetical protein
MTYQFSYKQPSFFHKKGMLNRDVSIQEIDISKQILLMDKF